jgi:OOP family OmpA-OmpF porin
MKKKLLCCALMAGIGLAQSASAQSYDDRWYFGAGSGVSFFDRDRRAHDEIYGLIAVGKRFNEHWALDAELYHTNPDLQKVEGILLDEPFPSTGAHSVTRDWELMSLSLTGRYYFMPDKSFDPYALIGIGAQEHHDGTVVYQTFPEPGFNPSRTGTDVVVTAGLGAQWDLGYPYLRAEAGVRVDTDDESFYQDDNFVDYYMGFEFIFPIGPEAAPAAPPPPPPPAKTCAELDDDGDGVNNCDDKCYSEAGSAVGPDGCPVPPPEPVMEPKPFRG